MAYGESNSDRDRWRQWPRKVKLVTS